MGPCWGEGWLLSRGQSCRSWAQGDSSSPQGRALCAQGTRLRAQEPGTKRRTDTHPETETRTPRAATRRGTRACSCTKSKLKCKSETSKETSILRQRLQESPEGGHRTSGQAGLRASTQGGCARCVVCGRAYHAHQVVRGQLQQPGHTACPAPAPPSIAPAESHPGHPSLPVSPRRAAIRASPSPPLASGPPSEAPYPCCFVLLLHRRESATPVRNPQGLCSPVTRHTSLGLVPRGPRPLASAPPTWLPRPGVRPLLQEAFPGSLIPRVHVPSETASQNFP